MPNVKCRRVIHVAPADLFALAQDYGVRLEWDTFSRRLVFLDGAQQAAPGVRARGQAWNGLTMTVEYITVSPPSVAAMKMLHGPFFFSSFSGSWTFKPLGASDTIVTFNYHFATPWKWPSPVIDFVLGRVLLWEMRRRLKALQWAAEKTDILKRVSTFRTPG